MTRLVTQHPRLLNDDVHVNALQFLQIIIAYHWMENTLYFTSMDHYDNRYYRSSDSDIAIRNRITDIAETY